MTTTIAITSNWQVHIPKTIRKQAGLKKPSKATIKVKGGTIIIKPQESEVLKLVGKYKHLYKKKPIDIDNIRDHIDYSKA